MSSQQKLTALFSPASVAITGNFYGTSSLSSEPIGHLNRWGYHGNVYIIDSSHPLTSIPESPDVVMIDVPFKETIKIMRECGKKLVPFVIVFTYIQKEGEYQEFLQVIDELKFTNTRVLGPHCQGIVNCVAGVPLCWSSALNQVHSDEGNIAFISQSGALGFSFFSLAESSGLGFRYMATTGVGSDLNLIELGEWMIEDEKVKLLVFYLEGLQDGRSFLDLVRRARAKGISVVVMRGGVSPCVRRRASGRQGVKHFVDQDIWETVARQFGILLVDDFEGLIDLGKVFVQSKSPLGSNVAILSLSSGLGMVQADRCVTAGLKVPPLSKVTSKRLSQILLKGGYVDNPLDLTVEMMDHPELFSRIIDVVMEASEVDMIFLALPVMSQKKADVLADVFAEANKKGIKPIVCCWLIDSERGANLSEKLDVSGIPLFKSSRRCARAMGSLFSALNNSKDINLICSPSGDSLLNQYPRFLNQYESASFVAFYGIEAVRQFFCRSMEETLNAGEELGYPVVLKIVSSEIQSKEKARGIALNLRTEEELRNAYGRILERASRSCPGAIIDGVIVQEMISGGVECMIGMKRDPTFGPVIAVGIGGVLYNVIRDLSFRLAPVNYHMALEMVQSLRGFPLLSGIRGSEVLDFRALAREIVKVSNLACSEQDLQLLDINPVFVTKRGVQIVDVYAYRKESN